MGQTLATLDPILKEVYQGDLNKQLNSEARAINRIKKTDGGLKENGGRYVRFAIHTQRNNGIGARRELEALPGSGKQGFAEGHIGMRFLYASVGITGQTVALADKSHQSFASAVDTEMSYAKDDIQKEENRIFWGDGLGTRTSATGVPVGQVIPVLDARRLDNGGVYDVHVIGTATPKTTITVTKQDKTKSANKITVTGTVTGIVAGDIFVRKGSYDREWHGIQAILSDSTILHNIDPNVVDLWKANMMNLAPDTPVSELTMLEMQDNIFQEGGSTSVMWTTLGLMRNYFSMLAAERKFVNKTKFEGGFTGVSFMSPNGGEIPFLADIDAPKGKISYLNEKSIHRYDATGGYKFMDRTGSIWRQKRQGDEDLDAYEATMHYYGEMGTTRRNTHGQISGLKDV